jgi:hypothetical protein
LKNSLTKPPIYKKNRALSGEERTNPGEARIIKVMRKISSNSSRSGNL